MRKDVKAGLVLALGVVIVAGWYYSSKKSSEPTIPLAKSGDKTAIDKKKKTPKSSVASRDTKKRAPRSTKPRSTNKSHTPKRTTKTDSTKDRLASAKNSGDQSKRSGRADSSKDAGGLVKPADGLDHVTDGLANMAKPKSQAIPPIASADAKKGNDALKDTSSDKASDAKKDPIAAKDTTSSSKDTGAKIASSNDRSAAKSGKRKDAKTVDAKVNMDGSERYIVQPGDSFTLLAEVYYGSQSHAGFLMRANPHVKDPKRLRVGMEIRIPELPKDSSARARASAGLKVDATPTGRTYVVKAGDSLTSIAEKQLGATARWKELYELNKDVIKNPDVLRSGVVLVLPKT